MAASLDGLSPNVPLYKVSEGNEPCFFTTFFSWDSTRATIRIPDLNFILESLPLQSQARSNGNQGGSTQRAPALAALTFAFNPSSTSKMSAPNTFGTSQSSQRAAAVAALSSVLTAEKKPSHDGSLCSTLFQDLII